MTTEKITENQKNTRIRHTDTYVVEGEEEGTERAKRKQSGAVASIQPRQATHSHDVSKSGSPLLGNFGLHC